MYIGKVVQGLDPSRMHVDSRVVQGLDPLHTYDGGEIHVVTLWLTTDAPGNDIAWLVIDSPTNGSPTAVSVAATEDEALRLAEEARAERERRNAGREVGEEHDNQ